MHAVRMMERDFGVSMLETLFKFDEEATHPPFIPEAAEFLWMSARLYLLILALRIAHERPGVNVNRLLSSGPGSYDPLSNMAHMTGIPVEVRRVDPR